MKNHFYNVVIVLMAILLVTTFVYIFNIKQSVNNTKNSCEQVLNLINSWEQE